jgi:hypothetical protein
MQGYFSRKSSCNGLIGIVAEKVEQWSEMVYLNKCVKLSQKRVSRYILFDMEENKEIKENYDELIVEEMVKEEVREEFEELRQSIEKFSHRIGHIFSYYQTFTRGIVQGVGIAIGTSIIFVLLSAFLYQLFTYFDFGSDIKELLPVKHLPGGEK